MSVQQKRTGFFVLGMLWETSADEYRYSVNVPRSKYEQDVEDACSISQEYAESFFKKLNEGTMELRVTGDKKIAATPEIDGDLMAKIRLKQQQDHAKQAATQQQRGGYNPAAMYE